ncbi:MAG: acyl-CoA thioesterase [Meiothermus sp.]|uniref:acyl-CoA thioesterase n=1 Tax=Meiothermus sp. TaxID=1955249 RepID=UPI00260EE135|nr:thioesterase family protein [Meiothermus sp.]MCS7059381.1 acyl-CoA thioesterase [Meiothermus sp.]MCX7739783.1 acyl-CoA thioesterase [Meiothermus sp.]MDW8090255.1 thioesterase family protein [Meiothermus sp.]MDW8481218.1 thioesterase family protein [Meiothermus sp.]
MTVRLPLTVRYAETDAMGVVHHSSYVVWLEAARVEWLERVGLPYPEVEAQGLAFAVVELGLTYRRAARFGEVVEVEVWLAELASRTLSYRYRVWRGEALLAEGFTRHLCQDARGKAARIPSHIAQVLGAHLGS